MTTFIVVLAAEPDTKWISASCPAMPGAVSQGQGREQALENIAEAMEGWLDVATDAGDVPHTESIELIMEEVSFVLRWQADAGWPCRIETAQVAVSRIPLQKDASNGRGEVSTYLSIPDQPELRPGTVRSIARNMGMNLEEFVASLET